MVSNNPNKILTKIYENYMELSPKKRFSPEKLILDNINKYLK